jgi:hypothetical protein
VRLAELSESHYKGFFQAVCLDLLGEGGFSCWITERGGGESVIEKFSTF